MALRLKIIDLSGSDGTIPFTVPVDCAYWSLRVITDGSTAQTMNGTPLTRLITSARNNDTPIVAVDFPPVFDAKGKPVMWNDQMVFNGAGLPILGTITLVYDDPGLAPTPH
jgi:hypothetical protein